MLTTQKSMRWRIIAVFVLSVVCVLAVYVHSASAASAGLSQGDLNCDGTVNYTDLDQLKSEFGTTIATSDVNNDGKVTVVDLSILLAHYNQTVSICSPGGGGSTGSVLFSDDFNGAAGANPDSSKWTDYGPGCGAYAGWGDIRCGADEKLDGNGHMVLNATPSWGSGIQTKGLYAFQYGTLSAWIKMPSQNGYWPGFWTLNGSQTGGETLTGESDISEVYTQWKLTNATVHVWNGGSQLWDSGGATAGSGIDLTAAYHKYSGKFEPGKITYYLDDKVIATVTKTSGQTWAFGPDVSRGNFIIFDLAVGGAGQSGATSNAQMLVDRVEVTAN